MMRRRLVFALAVALTACSSQRSEGASAATATMELAVHPVSGLQLIPVTVIHQGKRHTFKVEVARTAAEQARGLMFRTEMGQDEGMIFPSDPPREGVAFWMKNTVIPLDILFIGTDHRVLNIAAQATPYSLQPLPAAGVVSGVLEINGGRAAELGIAPGDLVEW